MALTQVTSIGLKDGEIVNADLHSAAAIALSKLADTGALGSAITATTQSASDDTTKLATTAFVQAAVTSLIDGAPGSLNTLNELAAAINDDSSYATTLTTALATKLPLAGGSLTGDLSINDNSYIRVRATGDNSSTAIQLGHDGTASFTGVVSPNTHVDMPDNAYLKLGTSDDLKIYHDGSNSTIHESGTGSLIVRSSEINLNNADNTEHYARFFNNGAAELYWGGTGAGKKLDTYQYGVNVTGNITTTSHVYWGDNGEAIFGTDADLKIYSNNSENRVWAANGALDLRTTSASNVEILANDKYHVWCEANGMTALYNNGSRKLQTLSNGARILGAEGGDAWLELYADEGDDHADKWGIKATHVGNEFAIQGYASGSWQTVFRGTDARTAELHYQGNPRLATTSTGIAITGGFTTSGGSAFNSTISFNDDASFYGASYHVYWDKSANALEFQDHAKATFGTDNDLQIWHSGSHAYVMNQVGNLNLRINSTEDGIIIVPNGAVQLYHNDLLSYTTATYGGDVQSNATTVYTKYKTSEGTTRGYVYANGADNIGFLTNTGSWAFRLESDKDYQFYGNNVSDRDLKDNITTVTGTSLDKITKLVPKTYNWKATADGRTPVDRTFTGFIAQEVKEHLPNLVTGTDGQQNMAVDYNGILAYAVKAITELSAEVETLKTKVAALEGG